MAAPARHIEDLAAAMERLERKLDALLSRERPRRRGNPDAELLTKREAARRLGVDRCTTLEQLLAGSRIRAVEVAGHLRIPRSEIERVLAEGVPTAAPRQRAKRREAAPAPRPGALRAVKLDDL